MLIPELAKEVHLNAVSHGWWDEERQNPEIIALIHSEWSEALEEARAGRPLAYKVDAEGERIQFVTLQDAGYAKLRAKPEGVAVELIDGVIRILDYLGKINSEIREIGDSESTIERFYSESNLAKVPEKLPELVAYLHLYTSQAFSGIQSAYPYLYKPFGMMGAMAAALSWVKKQGIDPLALLLDKHEYNKTRPYKHGKKF